MLIGQTHPTHVASIAAKVHPSSRARSSHKHGVDAAIKSLAIFLLHGVTRGEATDVDWGRGQVGVGDDLGDVESSDLESDIAADTRMDPETEAGGEAVAHPDLTLQPLNPQARVKRELHNWASFL